MDKKDNIGSALQGASEELPSIFRYIQSNGVAGFDTTASPRGYLASSQGAEPTNFLVASPNLYSMPSPNSPIRKNMPPHHPHSVSISMPISTSGVLSEQGKTAGDISHPGTDAANVKPALPTSSPVVNLQVPKQAKFHSQPMAAGTFQAKGTPERKGLNSSGKVSMPISTSGVLSEQAKTAGDISHPGTDAANVKPDLLASSPVVNLQVPKQAKFHSQPMAAGTFQAKGTPERKGLNSSESQQRVPRNSGLKQDHRYNSFKTWSGALERQISTLRGKPPEPREVNSSRRSQPEPVPAPDRYFDALEGPELETLRASEELVLPEDKLWPFLLRFPVSSFGMCLGVSSQAILWKTLATSPSTTFLHVSPVINLVLWCISLALTGTVAFIYSLKIIFYFEAVRREYYHPIRVNFFFAPWITCLFLALGFPPIVAVKLHDVLWYVLMAPILCLEIKIYGQWMSGGRRRLSKVANPSNHLSIVGNFVGALLGASMGLKEGPIFFFAVGLAHYSVLFVTLYQRLPTNETLPKELHPVFFLFVAAPSVASLAWAKITGEFGYGSRIAYFIALFLYVSLAVRINFFRGFRFSLAWWAYTFPMTGASIATIRYSAEAKNLFTQSMSVALSGISTLTVIALLVSTIIHAFVLNDLFTNDISIAISNRRPKGNKRRTQIRSSTSDAKDTAGATQLRNGGLYIKETGASVTIDIGH